MRVLDDDESRRWKDDMSARLHGSREVVGGEESARADGTDLDAGIGGSGARLVPEHMRFAADDHLIARTRKNA